jgi:outer membrane murein-binding lipoprotein Lpp
MNAKGWIITIGIVVGALILGWFVVSGSGSAARADQLVDARREKARKKKERERAAAGSTNTETEAQTGND